MKQSNQKAYDPSIIRLQLRIEDFRFRGPVISTERLRDVKKVLLTFHTLETMTAHKFGYLLSIICFRYFKKATICFSYIHLGSVISTETVEKPFSIVNE